MKFEADPAKVKELAEEREIINVFSSPAEALRRETALLNPIDLHIPSPQ